MPTVPSSSFTVSVQLGFMLSQTDGTVRLNSRPSWGRRSGHRQPPPAWGCRSPEVASYPSTATSEHLSPTLLSAMSPKQKPEHLIPCPNSFHRGQAPCRCNCPWVRCVVTPRLGSHAARPRALLPVPVLRHPCPVWGVLPNPLWKLPLGPRGRGRGLCLLQSPHEMEGPCQTQGNRDRACLYPGFPEKSLCVCWMEGTQPVRDECGES